MARPARARFLLCCGCRRNPTPPAFFCCEVARAPASRRRFAASLRPRRPYSVSCSPRRSLRIESGPNPVKIGPESGIVRDRSGNLLTYIGYCPCPQTLLPDYSDRGHPRPRCAGRPCPAKSQTAVAPAENRPPVRPVETFLEVTPTQMTKKSGSKPKRPLWITLWRSLR